VVPVVSNTAGNSDFNLTNSSRAASLLNTIFAIPSAALTVAVCATLQTHSLLSLEDMSGKSLFELSYTGN